MSTSDEPSQQPRPLCACTETTAESTLSENECTCVLCPTDKHGITIHTPDCILFKSETFVFPDEVCECDHPESKQKLPCECYLADDAKAATHSESPEDIRKTLNEWRKNRDVRAMPAVLEAAHPLMQRFQKTLREFLLKENALAEEEILNLKDDLRLTNLAHSRDLETIYKDDNDCNAQRVLIEEYEVTVAERVAARQVAEQRVKESLVRQKLVREQLDRDLIAEREVREELESLTTLCQQLEKWREETESELNVSQHMSDKMRNEKRVLADEKREMDVMVFRLTNEVWKLDSKLEMLRKQMEIKSVEMNEVNDKVAAYSAELEDLDLDKRRLVSLWNGVVNNISQRDKAFDSVREDYLELQNNFNTLVINLDTTKKAITEEIDKGKEVAMTKEKILYDTGKATHLLNHDNLKRVALETETAQVTESIDMTDKDIELLKAENFTLSNILKSSCKEMDHKVNNKLKLENDILTNLQECLLNNKAVEHMANGIRNMRKMSRNQEVALSAMESQHDRMMLDLEIRRNSQDSNERILKDTLATVHKKEMELSEQQEKYKRGGLVTTRKRRELDVIIEKYLTLKEIFDAKTPQQLRIEELEKQTQELRERTSALQHEWLRVQGFVVRLAEQHQAVLTDIHLIRKQLQICDQNFMRVQAEGEKVTRDASEVDRRLRDMRGRMQVLEKTRKEMLERNHNAQKSNVSITHEYAANLKGEEMQLIELEDEIEAMDKEKVDLTQNLDRVQREALIWQRKGILAVELKKNMKEAKSAAGEIGQMKHEIHRMEARREQLRRTGEKLSEDLAHCVRRRESAVEKTRAYAAVEKAHGARGVSQSAYHHKLRLVRADLVSVKKQLNDAEATLKQLNEDQKRLECAINKTKTENTHMEERIARLIQKCRETERQKHWLLERVVRSQRFGSELAIVVKRQSLQIKKPKPVVIKEYINANTLNDRIKFVVQCLTKEYPHFSDKLAMIANTLEIHSPNGSPRLAESPFLCDLVEENENVADNQQNAPEFTSYIHNSKCVCAQCK